MTTIPTESLGSLPRPRALLDLLKYTEADNEVSEEVRNTFDESIKAMVTRYEATGSPVITDGEYGKYPDFITYPLRGQSWRKTAGFGLTLDDINHCQLPELTKGPFHYTNFSHNFLIATRQHTSVPIKHAVISPSTLSLLYPARPLADYSRDDFVEDLLSEHISEIRQYLHEQAYKVQIDFCDGPLALRLDPSGQLLNSFVLFLNMAMDCFSDEEQRRLGIYIGTHQADAIDIAELIPVVLELPAKSFYIATANRTDKRELLSIIRANIKPDQRIFIGVIDPASPYLETVAEVRDAIIEASRYIPPDQLGTTDNTGFAPFADNPYTDLETALERIRVRVEGTALASDLLGGATRK